MKTHPPITSLQGLGRPSCKVVLSGLKAVNDWFGLLEPGRASILRMHLRTSGASMSTMTIHHTTWRPATTTSYYYYYYYYYYFYYYYYYY
jgi:hypothetical protein